MKSFICLLIVMSLIVSPCFAQTDTGNNPGSKLMRGVMNIGGAILELPKTMVAVSQEKNAAVGLTVGTLEGVASVLLKAMVGIYETVTFPIAVPANYAPVLQD